MSFGRPGGALDSFRVLPPDRGSFPLDHDGECKEFMMGYLKCLKLNGGNNGECRMETKKYLSCRMDNNLMTRDDMSNIGLGDLVDDSHTTLRPDPSITNVNVDASANANANANVKTTNTTTPTPPTTQERI